MNFPRPHEVGRGTEGEGVLLQCVPDGQEYRGHVSRQLSIRDPQDAISECLKGGIPKSISVALQLMNTAIEFHDQLSFHTDEIDAVATDEVLAPELQAHEFAVAKFIP